MTKKKKKGRPPKHDSVREELLANLREPMSIKAAYTLAGVSERTYYRRIDEDEEWAQEVEMAKRYSEAVMVAKVQRMSEEKGDWRAFMFLLKQRFPDEYGDRQQIELNQTVNDGGAALVIQMIEQTDQRLMEIRDEQGESGASASMVDTAPPRKD